MVWSDVTSDLDTSVQYTVEIGAGCTGTVREIITEEFFKVSPVFEFYTGFLAQGKHDC